MKTSDLRMVDKYDCISLSHRLSPFLVSHCILISTSCTIDIACSPRSLTARLMRTRGGTMYKTRSKDEGTCTAEGEGLSGGDISEAGDAEAVQEPAS